MGRKRTRTHRIDSDGEWVRLVPILTEPRFSQPLERGLAILGCFTPERPVWGIADISDALGMPRSTTHRYVLTLTTLGYLVQGAGRKYRLALRVTTLGMSAMSSTSLQEHARPYLEELRDRTGFTIVVGVLDGPEVLLLDRLCGVRRGQHQIDLDQAPGTRLAAHCTAIGKLLLAYLPDHQQRAQIAEMRLPRRTPNTIANKRVLQVELQSIREQGLAAAEQELAPALYSIAAPVRTASREAVAALGMDAHSSTIPLEELIDALGPHLIATADRISARLGYRRTDELHRSVVRNSSLVEASER